MPEAVASKQLLGPSAAVATDALRQVLQWVFLYFHIHLQQYDAVQHVPCVSKSALETTPSAPLPFLSSLLFSAPRHGRARQRRYDANDVGSSEGHKEYSGLQMGSGLGAGSGSGAGLGLGGGSGLGFGLGLGVGLGLGLGWGFRCGFWCMFWFGPRFGFGFGCMLWRALRAVEISAFGLCVSCVSLLPPLPPVSLSLFAPLGIR